VRILLLGFTLIATAAFASELPPDKRSWEQVTADFVAREVKFTNDGDYDGRRLKELDPKRAAAFLIPFLAKEQPLGMRVKAIGALGWSSFHEAIPALSAIALDPTDNEAIRARVLNPGLRYMRHPEAVKTAAALANDKSDGIRSGALWVLSDHGTDDAIDVLAARLRANDKPLITQLIFALTFSKHRRAGKIIFDLVDFSALPHDERHLHAYSIAMEEYRIPEAQANMFVIAQQPERPLSAYYALRYFSTFPREAVVPALVAYIEANKSVSDLYDTVTEFIKSRQITDESKAKLSAFIATGKVKNFEQFNP